MSRQTFVITGASLAGAKAAEALREQGFDGRVVLVGSEPDAPYERPPLSKDYLRGETGREKALVHEHGFYEQHQIELLTATTATAIDPGARRVTLDDGQHLEFDQLLVATGAEPRRLKIPGAELDGVYYLRTLADAEMLQDRIGQGGHVVVLGAGWIGSEVAASARQKECQVTLVDPLQLPNERIFGPEIGSFYRELHAARGVALRLGDGAAALEGKGAVQRVRTASGDTIECDFVVVGIGVIPRVELAQAAGLDLDNGIAVNEQLQTSAEHVYAAGDVAAAWHPFYGRRIRVEHWSNALHQGQAAARAMLGEAVSYDRIPYFFSDQYDVGMEYSGYATQWDEVVFRGDRASGEFIAFWLREERVVAGMNVNVWDVNDHVQALIRSRARVDRRALTDPDTPLGSLAGKPAGGS